jgi:hypothetical protein
MMYAFFLQTRDTAKLVSAAGSERFGHIFLISFTLINRTDEKRCFAVSAAKFAIKSGLACTARRKTLYAMDAKRD